MVEEISYKNVLHFHNTKLNKVKNIFLQFLSN